MEDWTEKYRPQTLTAVAGNEKAISQLRYWAQQWNSNKPPKKRAIVLIGRAGTGKTSSAHALARDFGWTIVELNASDARNADIIKRIATSGALNETFDNTGRFTPVSQGGRKLIILDEADNLYERSVKSKTGSHDFSDRGGKKAIIDTIKKTNQPIILIVNDKYGLFKGSGDVLKHLCMTATFYDVQPGYIIEVLKRICRQENITADSNLLRSLADRCNGDVRSAVNDLQSICMNRTSVDIQSLDSLGYRDREKIIFDGLRDVFKTKNIQTIKESISNVDVNPETLLLWISENLPREYIAPSDLVSGFEMVSRADVFFGRVYRRQYYRLWSYACDLMTGGVATAKTHTYGNTRYYPPTWIKELSRQKSSRNIRDSIVEKIRKHAHCSKRKIKQEFLEQFMLLFRRNTIFACKMRKQMELSEAEVAYLLGEQQSSKIKQIMECVEKSDEKQMNLQQIKKIKEHKQEKQPQPDVIEKEKHHQPSIFDFK